MAACWIALVAPFAYVANTGSGDISEYLIRDGAVTLVNPIPRSPARQFHTCRSDESRY